MMHSSHVPHYYGDYVRLFFIIVAVLLAFAIPVLGDIVFIGVFPQVAGIVLLIMLAGLTNPHGTLILWADAILSAVGVVLLEGAAISAYSLEAFPIFLVREIGVFFLLLALYFSIKTVRAMAEHEIGHIMNLGEFDEPSEKDD